MRVLVVHHGRLPPAPDEPDRPVSGGALRASWHVAALKRAGHEVLALTRDRDAPGGFEAASDLLLRASAWAPDRIVAVQPEDAPALRALGVPLAVDLYAPRLLEAAFEGLVAREATVALRALAVGDVFLCSNARQRWSWLGIMALAGLDLRVDPTLLVPLVAEPGPERSLPEDRGEEPILVAGGASWSWQDPRPGLLRALAALERRGRGRVVWYGGGALLEGQVSGAWTLPEHPRLRLGGWLGRRALLAEYARASAAIDWMVPNVERGLAFAFRHADYLGAGLPILTGPDTALTDLLGEAGWVGDDIEAIIDQVIDHPVELRRRSVLARRLAEERLSLEVAGAPLQAWVESGWRAPRAGPALAEAAQLATEAARERALREALAEAVARSEAEVQDKRAEVARLSGQVASLTGIADRLSRALDEVAGFKREAIAVLGGQASLAQGQERALSSELALLRADLAKKNAELDAALQLQGRLENDLRAAHAEIERGRKRGLFRS